MTTVVVLCDPPREGLVLPALPDSSPLSAAEATGLYAAMLKDVCRAVETSGGDLLVNYRPDENLPDGDGDETAEADVRAVVRTALDDPDAARFERQVGETFAGRVGNTASHLLDQERVDTVAVVEPSAVFLTREQIDSAAMKLRRSPVVLGPSIGGRVYYAGFREPIDYTDAYAVPAVETLTERATDAGHDVDFLSMLPTVETGDDLADALVLIRSRQCAGRIVPEHTSAYLDGLGLTVTDGERGLELSR